MSKKKIVLSYTLDTASTVQYLETMVQGFKHGRIIVQKEGTVLTLNPSDMIEMTVEAKQKKDRQKIRIKLSWPTAEILISPDYTVNGHNLRFYYPFERA